MKTGVCLILICVLSACGFEPMAGQSTQSYDQQALPAALARVTIQAKSPESMRMIGQQFRIDLEDLINPSGSEAAKEYILDVSLAPIVQPGFITPDGKAQRFLVFLQSSYTLTRLSDGKLLESGNMRRNSSYSNLPNSYYSTYIAEQDTIKRLSKELAEQYRMKLASVLSSPPKTPGNVLPNTPPPLMTEPDQVIGLPPGQF